MSECQLTALGVGHGDAILLRCPSNTGPWTCLIDGGPSARDLAGELDRAGVSAIDLLILTHLDTDHVAGLVGLAGRMPVRSYWGPALPAFERFEWLFGSAGRAALARGRALEAELTKAGIEIEYPLEGFASEPPGKGVKLTVLSPAARLIRRLLTADDASELFFTNPTPLGWLARLPDEGEDIDVNELFPGLEQALATGGLRPADLVRRREVPEGVKRQAITARDRATSSGGPDPEFFGDSVLNNTSLVVYAEVQAGVRRHRILFPGDQENWAYLLARHPQGLHADILKAPHHGGRVYLETKESYHELLSAVRPAVVLVSASGRHDLPRLACRSAMTTWGATIACTCQRGREVMIGPEPSAVSCHEANGCTPSHGVTLDLRPDGITSSRQACHSGFGRDPGPVIRIAQHILDPSPIANRLAEQELRKHIAWVRRALTDIHQERITRSSEVAEGNSAVGSDQLASLARGTGRHGVVPFLQTVLREGTARQTFWAAPESTYRAERWLAYALPSDKEIIALLEILRSKVMVLFSPTSSVLSRDRVSVLGHLDTACVAAVADATLKYPAIAFRETFQPRIFHAWRGTHWHCYLHRTGSVAISTHADSTSLLKAVLTECGRQIWSPCVGAPVLACDSKRRTEDVSLRIRLLEQWIDPDQSPFGTIGKSLSQLEALSDSEVCTIAPRLAKDVEQLW